jgi:dTDP-glucose pyrophosphorylase
MHILTDFTGLICQPDASIRRAIAALNANTHLFQIVLGPDGHVLGTLTDGDVRRALLRNVSLDERVGQAMNRSPVVGSMRSYAELLPDLANLSGFLPLVDAEGRLKAVLVDDEPQLVMNALVLAGGRGTRLGERTRQTPKPLVQVGGQPIIEHVLRSVERAGVGHIFVAAHYLADQIEKFVAARATCANIELLVEGSPLGTAGALGLLPDLGDAPIFVLNGDLMTKVDLSAMAAFHVRNGFDITIGASEHRVSLPYGVIRYREDGTFLRIDEKPTLRHLVSGGIHLLSGRSRRLVKAGDTIDMPELINRAEREGHVIGVFPIHEYWQDVGNPDDLDRAERHYRSAGDATG